MITPLDPLSTSAAVVGSYERYLRSLVAPRDVRLAEALDAAVTSAIGAGITKGPLLEATPPYAPGATLRELVGRGRPARRLRGQLTGAALPAGPTPAPRTRNRRSARPSPAATSSSPPAPARARPRASCCRSSTACCAERAAGTLGPGVRALLLYPMNALANDQMKRLRRCWPTCPTSPSAATRATREQDPTSARRAFGSSTPGEPTAAERAAQPRGDAGTRHRTCC